MTLSQSDIQYHPSSQLLYASFDLIMGTRLEILLIGKEEAVARNVCSRISEEVCRLDKLMNKFDPESELFHVNKKAFLNPVTMSDELWTILTDCRRYYQLTSGYFDISLSDFSKVSFDESMHTISFSTNDIELDLGGYGKGYALRKIEHILREENVTCSLVNFGNSSVLAIGSHLYGDYWPVGITNPETGETVGTVQLKDNSMSTSGNSPGNPLHIKDPHSGAYYSGKELVTVVSSDPVDAEVLSTTLLIAPPESHQSILSHFNIDEYKVLPF